MGDRRFLSTCVRCCGARPCVHRANVSGHHDFIVFEPSNVQYVILGHRLQGLPNVPVAVLWLLLNLSLWLPIALVYRRGPVRSLATRALLWIPIFVVPFLPLGQLFDLPGEL
jgi:hypothetical protein